VSPSPGSREGERMFPLPPRPVEMIWRQTVSGRVEGASKGPYRLGIARRDGLPAASVRVVLGTVSRTVTRRRTVVARAATAGHLLFRRADKDDAIMRRRIPGTRKKNYAQEHDPARMIVRYVRWTYEAL